MAGIGGIDLDGGAAEFVGKLQGEHVELVWGRRKESSTYAAVKYLGYSASKATLNISQVHWPDPAIPVACARSRGFLACLRSS
jgi:hypothetical protein